MSPNLRFDYAIRSKLVSSNFVPIGKTQFELFLIGECVVAAIDKENDGVEFRKFSVLDDVF